MQPKNKIVNFPKRLTCKYFILFRETINEKRITGTIKITIDEIICITCSIFNVSGFSSVPDDRRDATSIFPPSCKRATPISKKKIAMPVNPKKINNWAEDLLPSKGAGDWFVKVSLCLAYLCVLFKAKLSIY